MGAFKMRTELISRSHHLFEMRVIGTLISTISYGVVISLAFSCVQALLKSKAPSPTTRRNLLVFVVVMFLISTFSVVEATLALSSRMFHAFTFYRLSSGAPISLPLAIWGADGFMLWRCVILYRGISRLPRIAVNCCVTFMGVKSLALGIISFLSLIGFMETIILIALTTAINLIAVSLIVLRLALHQVYSEKVFGSEDGTSPYSVIMTMVVESSALIVIAGVACIIASISNPDNSDAILIPLLLLPHICVISPLLIVHRVAQCSAAIVENPANTDPVEFALPIDTTSS